MRLSTISCAVASCDQEVSADIAMFHVVRQAVELGWALSDDSDAFGLCPAHAGTTLTPLERPVWAVGCYTCDFEEEYDEEERARDEYSHHECEPDPWLRSPAQLAERRRSRLESEERRARERAEEQQRAQLAAQEALAQQRQIERYARNWLRIRNTVLFWKRFKPQEGMSNE